MKLFRIVQEIDYGSDNLTSVQMMHTFGLEGNPKFEMFSGNHLLTIDQIVSLGGRPLKMPLSTSPDLSARETMLRDLDNTLNSLRMD